MPYRTSDLLSSIKLRGLLPTAAADITPANLLVFASEEMNNDLVPTINSAREDYYSLYTDFPLPADIDHFIEIPDRAIGAKLRNVQFVAPGNGNNGNFTEVPRRQPEEIPSTQLGYFLLNNGVHFINRFETQFGLCRLYWFMRPNTLVLEAQTANITAVSGSTVSVDVVPDGFQSGMLYDIVSAHPNFSTQIWDSTGTLGAQSSIALAGGSQQPGVANDSLLASVRVGDVISLATQTSVIQMPVEFHPVLAQAVIVKALEASGDREGMQVAQVKLDRARANALKLIGVRTENSPLYIVPIYAPARNWF